MGGLVERLRGRDMEIGLYDRYDRYDRYIGDTREDRDKRENRDMANLSQINKEIKVLPMCSIPIILIARTSNFESGNEERQRQSQFHLGSASSSSSFPYNNNNSNNRNNDNNRNTNKYKNNKRKYNYNYDFACGYGYDLLLPQGWGRTFFHSLILQGGARAIGLLDKERLTGDAGYNVYPRDYPDSSSSSPSPSSSPIVIRRLKYLKPFVLSRCYDYYYKDENKKGQYHHGREEEAEGEEGEEEEEVVVVEEEEEKEAGGGWKRKNSKKNKNNKNNKNIKNRKNKKKRKESNKYITRKGKILPLLPSFIFSPEEREAREERQDEDINDINDMNDMNDIVAFPELALPIKLVVVGRGVPSRGGLLYLPSLADLQLWLYLMVEEKVSLEKAVTCLVFSVEEENEQEKKEKVQERIISISEGKLIRSKDKR